MAFVPPNKRYVVISLQPNWDVII